MDQQLLISFIGNTLTETHEQMFILRNWSRRNFDEDVEFINSITSVVCNMEHLRLPGYFNCIDHYLDFDFFSLFRMNKHTFNILLQKVNCNEHYFRAGSPPIPPAQQLLMTLWWLGKGEVLLTIADRFNVVVSTFYKSTGFMLSRILSLQNQYITWPNRNETAVIQRQFEARLGYPGVVGAIDVCNIPFKAPSEHQHAYIDRKMQHSIKLQAVVTCEKLFINTMVGFPGSVHDSRVLRNSQLYLEVQNNGNVRNYFYDEQAHIVGDSAYPLLQWLMTPYRDNGHLTPAQRHHNRVHSQTRVVVENTFGILKSRWRALELVNVNSIIKAVRIISACCILHNFCYVNLDIWDNYVEHEHENDDGYLHGIDNNLIDMAVFKRNNL